jgi:hypothetical protein
MIFLLEQRFIDALFDINETLKDSKIEWAIGGDLGEALLGVDIDPEFIEIVTTDDGVYSLHESVSKYHPSNVDTNIQQLPRNASIGEKTYPVYLRSLYFEFVVKNVNISVHGSMSYRINDWDWGDPLDFTPQFVYLGKYKSSVIPLSLKYELYNGLGWTDRAEKVSHHLK